MTGEDKRGKYTSPEGSTTWEILASFSCSLMILSVGCMAGWNSPAIVKLQIPKHSTPNMTSIDHLQKIANSILNVTRDELQTAALSILNSTSINNEQILVASIFNMTNVDELPKSENSTLNETSIDEVRTFLNSLNVTSIDEVRTVLHSRNVTSIDELQTFPNSVVNMTNINNKRMLIKCILIMKTIEELQTFANFVLSNDDKQKTDNSILNITSIDNLETITKFIVRTESIDGSQRDTNSTFYITSEESSTLTMMTSFGHIISPPLLVIIVDNIGRKPNLLLSAVPLLISWALIIVAKNVVILYVGRFIAGLSQGFVMSIAPVYLGEIASTQRRGTVGMIVPMMFNLGILTSFMLVPQLSMTAMSVLCIVISIAFMGSFWFMPESPHFLAMLGKREEAEEALEKLRGRTDVSEEMEAIAKVFENKTKAQNTGSFKDLLFIPGIRKALIIGTMFHGIIQFGGFHTIMAYIHKIFLNVPSMIPQDWTAVVFASVQLISSVFTSFFIDKVNRRTMILYSGIISGLCNFVIGGYFYRIEKLGADPVQYSFLPFIAVIVLLIAITAGILGSFITLINEIFPTSVKGKASCTISVIGGIMGMAASKLYLMVAETWGYGHSIPFIVQGIVTLLCASTVVWLTPETRGKSFAEILEKMNR